MERLRGFIRKICDQKFLFGGSSLWKKTLDKAKPDELNFQARFEPRWMRLPPARRTSAVLVLTRKVGQRVFIECPGSNESICISIVRVQGHETRIGIEAPRNISIQRAELAQSGSRSPAAGKDASSQHTRILIVDDSPTDRLLYRTLLANDTNYDYSFREAECGEEGLEIFRNERPDCVLLDYKLPDLDGLEFLHAVVHEGVPVPSPIVMLSGYGDAALAAQAFKHGAFDYLGKGLLTEVQLQSAVHEALANRTGRDRRN